MSIAAPQLFLSRKEADKTILLCLQTPSLLAGAPDSHLVLVVQSGRLGQGKTLSTYTRDWVRERTKALQQFKELGRRPTVLGGLTGTCVTYSYTWRGSRVKSDSRFVARGATVYELRFAHPAAAFDAHRRLVR